MLLLLCLRSFWGTRAFLACEEVKLHPSDECLADVPSLCANAVRGLRPPRVTVAVELQFPRPWRRRGFIDIAPKPSPVNLVSPPGSIRMDS